MALGFGLVAVSVVPLVRLVGRARVARDDHAPARRAPGRRREAATSSATEQPSALGSRRLDRAILLARMATPAIVTTFLVSVALMVVSLWGHRRLAGDLGRPGCLSMGAFVLSWVFGIAATLTGLFLLVLVFGH